jgi:hypothetical protein
MRYILIIIYLLNLLCAQSNKPQVAPLNPHFIKYLEDKKKGLIHNINSKGYYNSIIPHPTDYEIDTPKNYKVATENGFEGDPCEGGNCKTTYPIFNTW